jgi:type II secretory pathway pseudopilin PulG
MIRNKKGVTLVELVLATLVLIIIVGVLSQILRRGLDSIDYGNRETELRQSGRVALTRMSREVRQALTTPRVTEEGKKISFSTDMDNDDTPEPIEYSWNGTPAPNGDLVRNEDGIETNIIEKFVGYFHLDLDEDERMITICLTLEEVFGERTYTVNLRSAVFLRREM